MEKTEYFSNSKTTSYLIDKVDIREKNIDTKIDFNLLYELDFSLTKGAGESFYLRGDKHDFFLSSWRKSTKFKAFFFG
jgi:hypothetical protein